MKEEKKKSRYAIAATPTIYAGITFRSRLEACWANLFDQIGMPWEYEPVQLDGWIPDFRLFRRFLVEVKPVAPYGFGMAFSEFEFFRKAIRSRWTILLGDGPGNDFGAIVNGADGSLGASTFFYDPTQPFLMRSVGGDGASDPRRGALEWHWRRAQAAVVNETERPTSWQRFQTRRLMTYRQRARSSW